MISDVKEVVEVVVRNLVSAGDSFSAYDVTKLARNLAGTEEEVVHQDVRQLVRGIFDRGGMSGYVRDYYMPCTAWVVYRPQVATPVPATPAGPADTTAALPDDADGIDCTKPVVYRKGIGTALRNATDADLAALAEARLLGQSNMYFEDRDGNQCYIID